MSFDLLVQIALGGAVLLAGAAIFSATLEGPAARHLVWAAAVGSALSLPALVRLPDVARVAGALPDPGPDAVGLALAAWGAGACAVLLTVAREIHGLRRLARSARPLESGPRARRLRTVAERNGARRLPRLLEGPAEEAPRTWGLLRPVLLLPPSSAAWSDERLEIVFVHELEHLRRGDWAVQLAAAIACALHWFDPLAWFAAARLRLERERACDAAVVRAGIRPVDYAGQLLWMARELAPPRSLAPGLGPSGLERRIRGLLDGAPASRLGRPRGAAIVAAVGAMACLWGSLGTRSAAVPVTLAERPAPVLAAALDPDDVACDRSRAAAERLLASLDAWDDPARRAGFLETAATIRQSRHQRRVFEALLARDDLDGSGRAAALRSASMIDKSAELSALLVSFARAHVPEGDLRRAYLEAALAIDRDADRARALSAIGIRPGRSPAT